MTLLARIAAAMMTAACLTGASCRQAERWGHYEPTPRDGWTCHDTLHFAVALPKAEPAEKAGKAQDRLDIAVRTDSRLSRTGITLMVRQRLLHATDSNAGERLQRIALPLTDDDGRHQGVGATLKQLRRPWQHCHLEQGDALLLDIWPDASQNDSLRGITDVGFFLI